MYYCQYIGIGSRGVELDFRPHAEKHGNQIKGWCVCVCVFGMDCTRTHKDMHRQRLYLGCLFIFSMYIFLTVHLVCMSQGAGCYGTLCTQADPERE